MNWKERLQALEAGQVDSTENAMQEAIDIYRTIQSEAKAMDEWKVRVKNVVSTIMVETGQMKWKTAVGQVYVSAPATVVTYNAKALDELCEQHPELKVILWPHRKETERAGVLTIRE